MPTIKKSAVTIEIHCDSSIKMNSYPGAIAQIITNLVLNSIEHGHLKADGIITIDVIKRKKNDSSLNKRQWQRHLS